MERHVIDHPHNEASALIAIHNAALLEAMRWTEGFWIACDEKPANKAIAAMGRRSDNRQWQVVPTKMKRHKKASDKKTDDAEAMARIGSWVYLFGSQFGSKEGPIQPKRHFIARFNASLVKAKPRKPKLKATMDLARPSFLLHRLVNDALFAAGIRLIPRGDAVAAGYIDATRDEDDDAPVRPSDHPINVEGATFGPHGRLLLGLRYPVTDGGHPIVVEVDGIDRVFVKKLKRGRPQITRVLVLSNVGSAGHPRGVRELDQFGPTIHVVTGNLDSAPDRSLVLADHAHGGDASSDHHTFALPTDGQVDVEATLVRRFDSADAVEGLAVMLDGTVWYAHDDERIRLARAAVG